jgi:hypothetical protein
MIGGWTIDSDGLVYDCSQKVVGKIVGGVAVYNRQSKFVGHFSCGHIYNEDQRLVATWNSPILETSSNSRVLVGNVPEAIVAVATLLTISQRPR